MPRSTAARALQVLFRHRRSACAAVLLGAVALSPKDGPTEPRVASVTPGTHPGMAICAAVQPVASLVADTDVAINLPLLHRLVDEGVLAIRHEGPPPGRKGRLYALTTHGARRLAELRCCVREAGQRA